jgi:hypothetical protein
VAERELGLLQGKKRQIFENTDKKSVNNNVLNILYMCINNNYIIVIKYFSSYLFSR